MCGIIGTAGGGPVASTVYEGLCLLQHRGQDSAGMTMACNGRFSFHRGKGLVRDVFSAADLLKLEGDMGIGHVRYPTSGRRTLDEIQPFYVNSPYGIALAHNGNLVNVAQLREELHRVDRRHLNSDSDSEVLLNILADELQRYGSRRLTADGMFAAVAGIHRRCRGGYAAIAMINGHGLLAFRDPHGIRPLVLGRRSSARGDEYMIASESCALDVLGFELLGDVDAGEAIFIDLSGTLHRRCCGTQALSPCIFEYVYLARPDSIIDGTSVYQARLRMGRQLAEKISREWSDHDIDVVIPVPDTSLTAAFELAERLGLTYREAFVKNRYIPRTFIMPTQRERELSVRRKLNAIAPEFRDRNVLLVDDSIVRGTTSRQIIQLARDAGARRVYFASAAPPVRFPNIYGIDMPTSTDLVASGRDIEEIAGLIGADGLVFQDLDDLELSVREGNPRLRDFECSIFTGGYCTSA